VLTEKPFFFLHSYLLPRIFASERCLVAHFFLIPVLRRNGPQAFCLFFRSDHIPNFSASLLWRSYSAAILLCGSFSFGHEQHTNGILFKDEMEINGREIQKDGCTATA
jgi:hypothetical protein